MSSSGALGINQMADKWAVRKIFGEVWKAAVESSDLVDPRVCPTIPMNKIRGVIPLLGNLSVQSQLKEYEHAEVTNAAPAGKNITLYKDRVRLVVSDEAKQDSDVGDPMQLQKGQASAELAGNLDALIAAQIWTTPQVYASTAVNWASASPLVALGSMIQTLRPYKATAVVMTPYAFAKYVSALGDKTLNGATSEDMRKGIATLPGYNIPVIASTHAADNSTNGFAVVSSQCPGLVLGTGAIKTRQYDNADLGAEVWQYDVWRTPVSNLRQNSSSLNLGVITGVHA